MGFRNPITSAVDQTARDAAASAQQDAATALTQIIPGSRLAADAIDGKTITGVTIGGSTVTGSLVRATGSGDASATSTAHALQAGPTNSLNTAIDGNEIVARNNGVLSPLGLSYPRTNTAQEAFGSALARKDYVDGRTDGLISAGNVTITPVANTPTSAAVTFPRTFAAPPAVVVTSNTSGPGTAVLEVSVSNVTTTGCTVWLDRVNTVATAVYWVAVAQG